MVNHKHSTFVLIFLLFIVGVLLVEAGLSSSEVDELCSQDNHTLFRWNGNWTCANLMDATWNITVNNVTIYNNKTGFWDSLDTPNDITDMTSVAFSGDTNTTGDIYLGGDIIGQGQNINLIADGSNTITAQADGDVSFGGAGYFFWNDGTNQLTLSSPSARTRLNLASPSNKPAEIDFIQTARSWLVRVDDGSLATAGDFVIYDASTPATRLTIDSSGQVGIGTETPYERFVVSGADNRIVSSMASGSGGFVVNQSGGGDALIEMYTPDGEWTTRMDNSEAGQLEFHWNDAEVMVLNGTGERIGMGTTNPLTRLHVQESDSSISYATPSAVAIFESNEANTDIVISLKDNNAGRLLFASPTNINDGVVGYHEGSKYLWFETNDIEEMRLTATGLGIDNVALTKLHAGSGDGQSQWFDGAQEDGLLLDTNTNAGRLAVVGQTSAELLMYDDTATANQGLFRIRNTGQQTTFEMINDAFSAITSTPITIDNLNGNIVVENDLNVSGNFSGNQYYGEFYVYDMTGRVTTISAANIYTNITAGTTCGLNNGFTCDNGTLTTNVAGIYKAEYQVSFDGSGGDADQFHSAVGIDGVPQDKCHSVRDSSSGSAVGSFGMSCLLRLANNEVVTIMVENMDDADNIAVYDTNLNLMRIGN